MRRRPTPMTSIAYALAGPTEVGELGAYQLKRLWSRALAARQGQRLGDPDDWQYDNLVLSALGLGLEQTFQYLRETAPSFEAFERWIVATTGGVEAAQVARLNAAIGGTPYPEEIRRWLDAVEASPPVLDADDLAFWEEQGYVVLHDAVSPEDCTAAEQAIWEHVGARPDAPESWYARRNNGI